MRKSRMWDRCFVALVAIALLGFFTAIAFALLDSEPRETRVNPIVQIR